VSSLPRLLDEAGISATQAEPLLNAQPAQVVVLEPSEADKDDRRFVAFLASLSLYITLAVYGNWVLIGVVEEKTSRIAEVLLGLLRPYELLAGKTLGIVVVALSQLFTVVAGALAGLQVVGADVLPPFALDVVLAAVPLYVLGVVLYSLLYAAVGATVSRQSDAQSAATPIVMLLLVPYMFSAIFVPGNPDGLAAVVFSLVPLTSPLVMPARVAAGDPTTLELVACYALLAPALLATAWLGGRVYAAAILSRGGGGWRRLLQSVLRPEQESPPPA
jgi:ABC-2 type transport system permease protein